MTDFDFKRRFVLKGMGALGAGGILVACGGGSSGNNSAASGGSGGGVVVDPTNASKGNAATCTTNSASIPLTIDASVAATGIPANIPIYAYITGLVKVPGQVFYRYDPTTNAPVQMSTSDNNTSAPYNLSTGLSGSTYSTNYPQPWANYSIQLDRTCATVIADLASFNGTNINGFGTGAAAFSGRIWISVGTPLIPFTAFAGANSDQLTGSPVTGYATPNPAPNAVGSLCMFDWLEFSYDSTGALNINTTQVDQYGFPISMTAAGTGVTGGEQGLFNKSRSTILSTLGGLSNTLFNSSIAVPTTGVAANAYPPSANTSGLLRALAPANTSGASSSTYLATPISNALNNWKTNWLSVTCPSNVLQQTYYGLTASDGVTLNFYTSQSTAGGPVFTFNDITTYNVLNCSGTMAGTGVSQVGNLLADLQNTGKAILAGFNRGVISSSTTTLNINTSAYTPPLSQNYTSLSTPYNNWAFQFHQFSSNGLAYGFSYDDVGSQQPTITTTSTSALTIQLGKFQ